MKKKGNDNLKKIGKEVAPGLYVLGDPRKAGYPSNIEIIKSFLPLLKKQILETSGQNSEK